MNYSPKDFYEDSMNAPSNLYTASGFNTSAIKMQPKKLQDLQDNPSQKRKQAAKDMLKILQYNGFNECVLNDNKNSGLSISNREGVYLGSISLHTDCNLIGIVEGFTGKLKPTPELIPKQQILDKLAQQDIDIYYYVKIAVNGSCEYVKWDNANWKRKFDYLSTALDDSGAYINSGDGFGIVEAGVTTTAI